MTLLAGLLFYSADELVASGDVQPPGAHAEGFSALDFFHADFKEHRFVTNK